MYPPVAGGIEKYIDSLRRSMPQVRSHVLVCSRGWRTRVGRAGSGTEVKVGELGPRLLSVPVAPGFVRRLSRIDADVIHVHMPNPLGEAAALLAADGRPVVASFHADIVRQARFLPAYRPLVEAVLDRAAALLVGSRRVLEGSPLLAARRDKARLLPYGVDVERYRPDAVRPEDVAAVRGRLGTPLVLSVARLVYYKGLDVLLNAARGLSATVAVAGDGPLRQDLERRARELPNVRLLGGLAEPELVRHLAAADCFVLPSTSRAESFGMATLEAQAMGLPAVVTDVGTGTLEAIEPGETGLAVPPADPQALSSALRSLLADADLRRRMSEAARRRASSRSLADHAAEVEEVYRSVSASPPA